MNGLLKELGKPGAVKLKSTETRDKSSLNTEREKQQLKEKELIQKVTGIYSEEDRKKYFFKVGMQNWYDKLKPFTFKTSFVDLTSEEADVIQGLYYGTDTGSLDRLSALEKRLDTCIKSEHASCAFIKLSTRSPKDSRSVFAKAVAAYNAVDTSQMDLNDRAILLQEKTRLASKVRNGEEAMAILLDSERVAEDLRFAVEKKDEAEEVFIVVRDFSEEVTPRTEIRGFAWGGKFTCAAQYYFPFYFKGLSDEKDAIEDDLRTFFDKIHPHIPVNCFVMDLVWFGPGQQPLLVEINPFDGEAYGTFPASTGLFNWQKDRSVMSGTQKGVDFELRILDKVPDKSVLMDLNPKFKSTIGL